MINVESRMRYENELLSSKGLSEKVVFDQNILNKSVKDIQMLNKILFYQIHSD